MTKQLLDCITYVDHGWHGIVRRAHEKLLVVVPNYEIERMNVQHGTLRIHLLFDRELTDEQLEIIDDILKEMEQESEETCEFCGRPGKMRETRTLWQKEPCNDCEE